MEANLYLVEQHIKYVDGEKLKKWNEKANQIGIKTAWAHNYKFSFVIQQMQINHC